MARKSRGGGRRGGGGGRKSSGGGRKSSGSSRGAARSRAQSRQASQSSSRSGGSSRRSSSSAQSRRDTRAAKRENRQSQQITNQAQNTLQQQQRGQTQAEKGMFGLEGVMKNFYNYQPDSNDEYGNYMKNTFASNMIQSAFDTQNAKDLAYTQAEISSGSDDAGRGSAASQYSGDHAQGVPIRYGHDEATVWISK